MKCIAWLKSNNTSGYTMTFRHNSIVLSLVVSSLPVLMFSPVPVLVSSLLVPCSFVLSSCCARSCLACAVLARAQSTRVVPLSRAQLARIRA
jgi:hypothetical protein